MTPLFGRFFQMVGLVVLPIALLVGLVQGNVPLEVRLLFIGSAFFVVGWLMSKRPNA